MEGFAGKVAVVTGAGSGIGQALAIELGRSGAKLAISDVDTEGLANTEEQLKAIGVQVKADRLDVTEREAFLLYADEVKSALRQGQPDLQQRGHRVHRRRRDQRSSRTSSASMDVDFWGVVNGTKAFLPHLIASGDGHVVNVSSLFGIFSVPGQAAYNAAKFAVRGFTEALRQEMTGQQASGRRSRRCTPAASRPRSCATPPRPRASTPRSSRTASTRELANDHAREGRQDHPRRLSARTRPACWSVPTPRPSTSSCG